MPKWARSGRAWGKLSDRDSRVGLCALDALVQQADNGSDEVRRSCRLRDLNTSAASLRHALMTGVDHERDRASNETFTNAVSIAIAQAQIDDRR